MVALLIIFELVLVAFVVWAILHENQLIDFENKLIYKTKQLVYKIKQHIRKRRINRCAKWLSQYGLTIVPSAKKYYISLIKHETK